MNKYTPLYASELSEHCSLNEAAFWISFSYVPEASISDYGECLRYGVEAIACGEGYAPDLDIMKNDFLMNEIVRYDDIQKYNELSEKYDGRFFVDAYILRSMENSLSNEEMEAYRLNYNSMRKEIEVIRGSYLRRLERAKIELFSRIQNGSLEISAVSEYSESVICEKYNSKWESGYAKFLKSLEIDQYFEKLNPSDFSYSDCDWENETITLEDRKMSFVRIKSLDLLDAFPPEEKQLPETIIAYRCLGFSILSTEHFESKVGTSRSRGRPKASIGAGGVERAIQHEFTRRKELGELADKKDAVHQAAIEFAHSVLNCKISRTAAQNYLREILQP